MFAIESYHRAASVAEAVRLLCEEEGSLLISGGTDVLIRLRELDERCSRLVDIHDLAELKGVTLLDDGTVRVGAGTTFSDLMASPVARQHLPMLCEAAGSVAGPQIRNVGTIGGNLCNGAVSADTCAPVLAYNARLTILGPQGARTVPALGFHTGPGKVALERGEVLLSIDVPREDWEGFGAQYHKYAMRETMDIATVGCAGAVRVEEGRIAAIRLACSVAAPVPVRCAAAESAALGQAVSGPALDETLQRIARAIEADVKPRTSWRASKEFRLHIIRTVATRVVAMAVERAVGRTAC